MIFCCYGCGQEGLFEFKNLKDKEIKRCSKNYRSCPVKRKEGGDALRGNHLSKTHKQNIREGTLGRTAWNTGLTAKVDSRIISGEQHPFFGKERSQEHRENLSKAAIGKVLSKEHKNKIGLSVSGEKNGIFGIKRSDETRQKISNTMIENKTCAGERNGNFNKNLDRHGIKAYRSKVMRLSRKTYEKFKDELNPNNLMLSSTEDNGYNIDHIVPISIGFKYNILPEIMASKINLQLLSRKDNIKKGNKLFNEELLSLFIFLGQA